MGRTALWTAILETLAVEIAAGHYAPGDRLPSEAKLGARFGVNRHTVRRALAELATREMVFPRRGAGVFVRQVPTPYPIGQRVRFHQNLLATGRVPDKRILHLETRAASAPEAEALALTQPAQVHVYEGISLSDGVPIATFRSIFPAERFPDLLEGLRETQSVTQTFAAHGVADYTRARTEVTAQVASRTKAALLEIRAGDPILKTRSINVDGTGRPVELGRSWFAASRVVLTVDGA